MAFTFKFFTEVLFLSIILCLANTGIVNVLVSTLYSKPDEVTGYECGLYSTKGGIHVLLVNDSTNELPISLPRTIVPDTDTG